MPIFTVPLHEYNTCHTPAGSPQGGQFCSTKGGAKARPETTRVGITSARPDRTGKVVFDQMRQFETQLRSLPGVSGVKVQPGLGAWQGGSEQTWVVAYKGNGAATKLLAKVGKQYDQDAVLMMKGCKGADCSPAVELIFDRGISGKVRDAVHETLTANGLGGWTWYKRGGKTMLRAVAVPQWGGDTQTHLTSMAAVSKALTAAGLTHRARQKKVRVSVMERETYDRYL